MICELFELLEQRSGALRTKFFIYKKMITLILFLLFVITTVTCRTLWSIPVGGRLTQNDTLVNRCGDTAYLSSFNLVIDNGMLIYFCLKIKITN